MPPATLDCKTLAPLISLAEDPLEATLVTPTPPWSGPALRAIPLWAVPGLIQGTLPLPLVSALTPSALLTLRLENIQLWQDLESQGGQARLQPTPEGQALLRSLGEDPRRGILEAKLEELNSPPSPAELARVGNLEPAYAPARWAGALAAAGIPFTHQAGVIQPHPRVLAYQAPQRGLGPSTLGCLYAQLEPPQALLLLAEATGQRCWRSQEAAQHLGIPPRRAAAGLSRLAQLGLARREGRSEYHIQGTLADYRQLPKPPHSPSPLAGLAEEHPAARGALMALSRNVGAPAQALAAAQPTLTLELAWLLFPHRSHPGTLRVVVERVLQALETSTPEKVQALIRRTHERAPKAPIPYFLRLLEGEKPSGLLAAPERELDF